MDKKGSFHLEEILLLCHKAPMWTLGKIANGGKQNGAPQAIEQPPQHQHPLYIPANQKRSLRRSSQPNCTPRLAESLPPLVSSWKNRSNPLHEGRNDSASKDEKYEIHYAMKTSLQGHVLRSLSLTKIQRDKTHPVR